jgi:hypothetical protein
MTKLEVFQKQGFLYYVKHPDFKGAGFLYKLSGRYFYDAEFSRTTELTENQVITLLS